METDDDIINEGRPVTPTEVAVATIWCKILQIRETDIHENFFDLGGLVHAELFIQHFIMVKMKRKPGRTIFFLIPVHVITWNKELIVTLRNYLIKVA